MVPVAGTAWISQFTNGTITKMNVATGQFSNTLALGTPGVTWPVGMATNGTGTRLYVTAYEGSQGRVFRIDLTTTPPTVLSSFAISTGNPIAIIAQPTGDIVYVGLMSGQIYKLDLASGTELDSRTDLPASSGYHFAFDQNRTYLYASSRDGGLYKLDPNTLDNVNVNSGWTAFQPQGIVFSPDWTRLYVALQTGSILVLKPSNLDYVARISTSGCSSFSLVYAKGLLYDGCVLEGKVVVLDPLAKEIKATETVNGRPREMSYDPATAKIVAPNEHGWVDRIDPPAIPEPRFVAPAPAGSPGNSGTIDSPWDLTTGLTSALVTAGTTVWLRGGTYGPNTDLDATRLGSGAAPIIYRQYPDERATIDGRLQIRGKYLTFWGFEAKMSNPQSHVGKKVIEVFDPADGIKLIDLVLHDAAESGVIIYWPSGSVEMRGCIIYNNGASNVDHGVYVQSKLNTGLKQLVGNVIFNNVAYGVHAFSDNTSGSAFALGNITLANNILFNNGSIANNPKSNIIMGGEIVGNTNLIATGNVSFWSPPVSGMANTNGIGIQMGYTNGSGFTAQGTSMAVQSNILLGGQKGLVIKRWTSATVTGNIVGGPVTNAQPLNPVVLEDPQVTQYNPDWVWNGNTYYHDDQLPHWVATYQGYPAGTIFTTFQTAAQLGPDQQSDTPYGDHTGIISNPMDPDRQILWAYKPNADPNGFTYAAFNLGSFLQSCYAYRVYNVQDMWNPVWSAPCPIQNLVLPMHGSSAPPLEGRPQPNPPVPASGPYFNAFVIVRY